MGCEGKGAAQVEALKLHDLVPHSPLPILVCFNAGSLVAFFMITSGLSYSKVTLDGFVFDLCLACVRFPSRSLRRTGRKMALSSSPCRDPKWRQGRQRSLRRLTRPRLARKHHSPVTILRKLGKALCANWSVQVALRNLRSAQLALRKLLCASCSVQVPCKLLRASCSLQVALCTLLCASCSVQVALRKLLCASCFVRAALCKKLCATDSVQCLCTSCSAQVALRKLLCAS